NLQMQAYQLAVIEGGFSDKHESRISAGAELVYLGSTAIDATTRRQPPVDADEIRAQVSEIAEGMSGSEFLATINKRCNQCDVRNACPIQSEGRTVME
ncbi:MAG TPA: PD-(D/E)XK nuclease family protein, partial [Candidatus Nanopelagicaceae bacterium]